MEQRPLNIPQALQAAVNYHQAGRLREAENIYRQILAAEPENADANHLLGIIAQQFGKHEAAAKLISRAIYIRPHDPAYHNNLGNAYTSLKKLPEAEGAFRQALALNPQFAEAHNNLGVTLKKQNKPEKSIAYFKNALTIMPHYAEAFYNLANALQELGNLDEAILYYKKALAIKSNDAEVLLNLGIALLKKVNLDEAETVFRKALTINPGHAELHYSLGKTFLLMGKLDNALENFRHAVAVKPEYMDALFSLANTLKEKNNLAESLTTLQKILAIDPEHHGAQINLGLNYFYMGQLDSASRTFQKTLTANPESAEAYCNLGTVLFAQLKIDEALQHFHRAIALKPDIGMAYSNLYFALNSHPEMGQDQILRETLKGVHLLTKDTRKTNPVFRNAPDRNRRLRIGYVSPDFRDHSVAYFIEPVIVAHNRANVEVFCYANVKHGDKVTERISRNADHWSFIGFKEDEEIAAEIRRDKIDILVDLAGHTAKNNLMVFARRPAPVQVNWLGYPNTTGLDAIGYRFTDEVADPVGEADTMHSESLFRLPHGFLCYHPGDDTPPVSAPPFHNRGCITFGSFNHLNKLTHKVIALWADIMHAVPGSRLLIKAKYLADEYLNKQIRKMFQEQGIEPDRLELFSMLQSRKKHLELYGRIDIGLDPFPYNGTTTTCEALWMGVPVVTLLGSRHASRVGASIMHHVGLEELIAESPEEYKSLVVSLANNHEWMLQTRQSLRARMQHSDLMDSEGITRTIEDAYRIMWHRWCDNHK